MGDLFVISRADIFAIYPQILTTILAAENAKRNFIKEFINLPTDSDYQERVYYRLLAVQKAINDLIDSGVFVAFCIELWPDRKLHFIFWFFRIQFIRRHGREKEDQNHLGPGQSIHFDANIIAIARIWFFVSAQKVRVRRSNGLFGFEWIELMEPLRFDNGRQTVAKTADRMQFLRWTRNETRLLHDLRRIPM